MWETDKRIHKRIIAAASQWVVTLDQDFGFWCTNNYIKACLTRNNLGRTEKRFKSFFFTSLFSEKKKKFSGVWCERSWVFFQSRIDTCCHTWHPLAFMLFGIVSAHPSRQALLPKIGLPTQSKWQCTAKCPEALLWDRQFSQAKKCGGGALRLSV